MYLQIHYLRNSQVETLRQWISDFNIPGATESSGG